MRKNLEFVSILLLLLLALANTSNAQVKKVEMKIDGYLCGF